jgi:hypothetical protein
MIWFFDQLAIPLGGLWADLLRFPLRQTIAQIFRERQLRRLDIAATV